MKTAISVPDDIFHEAEKLACRRRMSRSALYTAALKSFVQQHRPSDITHALNEVYKDNSSELDAVLNEMQMDALPKEEW